MSTWIFQMLTLLECTRCTALFLQAQTSVYPLEMKGYVRWRCHLQLRLECRFSADSVQVRVRITLGEKGTNVEVTDLELNINLAKINLELECLFPKDGKCCPEKYLKSCNAVLAKTVLRLVRSDPNSLVIIFTIICSDSSTETVRTLSKSSSQKSLSRFVQFSKTTLTSKNEQTIYFTK